MIESIYKPETSTLEPLALDVVAFARMVSISPRVARILVNKGAIPHKKIGSKTIISIESARAFVNDTTPIDLE